MNGSRLGRGRGGRLALYGGSMVILVLLVFLYRAATTEMTRLRELNVECSHQQKAQATQLQVIFEYKVGLEKSLSEEKNSNLALKRELERATREKTLRDKDSIKEIQRFNSLQQQHKILQSENQDLRDEISKARDDKEKSMEHLKNQYLEIEMEKTKFEEKYNDLLKTNGNTDSTIQHLNKQIFQLKRELDDAKLSCRSTLSGNNVLNQRTKESAQSPALPHVEKSVSTSQQLQKYQSTSIAKISPSANPTKYMVYSASTLSDKSLNVATATSPVKLLPRVKLPMGVVPIPKMNVQKDDKEELKKIDTDGNNLPVNNRNNQGKNQDRPRARPNNEEFNGAGGGRHIGEQIFRRQENPDWYKVKPGVQEIGDELNHPEKIPEFGDTGLHQGDQYENDYYKEPQPKNNDIHLDEGEEDEGEDEDEQADYHNNPRA